MLGIFYLAIFAIVYKMNNRIKELIVERAFKMDDLANKMNTTRGQIHKLIKGERQLTLQWLERFSKALNCDITDLIIDKPKITTFSEIDPERLYKTRKAVKKITLENKLNLSEKQVAKLVSEVYNLTAKYESQGKATDIEMIADIIVKKSS